MQNKKIEMFYKIILLQEQNRMLMSMMLIYLCMFLFFNLQG
jgi:hypothetical protein